MNTGRQRLGLDAAGIPPGAKLGAGGEGHWRGAYSEISKISIQGTGMASYSVDGAVGEKPQVGLDGARKGCYYPQDAKNFDCVHLSSSHCRISLISLSGITLRKRVFMWKVSFPQIHTIFHWNTIK